MHCQIRPLNVSPVLLQTLGLPTELFQIMLAKAVQQHGTALSLRLTCRSIAHGCAAALVTGETACQALVFPREHAQCCSAYPQASGCAAVSTHCRHPLPGNATLGSPTQKRLSALATACGHPPARLPQQHPQTEQCDLHSRCGRHTSPAQLHGAQGYHCPLHACASGA